MKLAFLVLITAVVTYAQAPSGQSKSDAEKIASAIHAKCNRARLAVFARRRVPRSPGWRHSVDLPSWYSSRHSR